MAALKPGSPMPAHIWPASVRTETQAHEPATVRIRRDGTVCQILSKRHDVIRSETIISAVLVELTRRHQKPVYEVTLESGGVWRVERMAKCGCGPTRTRDLETDHGP